MTDDHVKESDKMLILVHQHGVQYKKDMSNETIRAVAQHCPGADLTLNILILCNDDKEEDNDQGPQSTSFCSQYNDIVRRARRRTTGNVVLLTTNVLGSLLLAAAMGAAVGQEFAVAGGVGTAIVAAAVLSFVGVLLYLRQNAALRDSVHSQLQDLVSKYNANSNHQGVVEIRVSCPRQGLFLCGKPRMVLGFWSTRKDSNEELLNSTEEVDEEMGDWGVQLQQQDDDDDDHDHDTTIHHNGVL